MLLYLINPCSKMTSLINIKKNKLSKYLLWKPLGLLVIAGLTPVEWEIKIIDENTTVPDYKILPRPDLVGITAFTSQAPRAYEIAEEFRSKDVPVVMGGIHTSMCYKESMKWTDAVVIGEAESVWPQILKDVLKGKLKRIYRGQRISLDDSPEPRHDLLSSGYKFGSIQTTRGCPLSCIFCSVSAFNGKEYRTRPIDNVINELKNIKEKYILIVDDNLIGTNKSHINRAKELFKEIIKAKIKKKFIAQATINIADDKEFLQLASKAGLMGVFIGFESVSENGLLELQKKFNAVRKNDFRSSVKKIKKHGIIVLGSFIIGLDIDKKDTGLNIAKTGIQYGLDILNLVLLTPLPGTRLWKKYISEKRIIADNFPEDWKYYTFTLPVSEYKNLSWNEMLVEFSSCFQYYYTYPRIIGRFLRHLFINRRLIPALIGLIANLNYKSNFSRDKILFKNIVLSRKTLQKEIHQKKLEFSIVQ